MVTAEQEVGECAERVEIGASIERLQLELGEVSIVSEPAYDGTSVALRSLDAARKEKRAKAAAPKATSPDA